jgi:hypothetical protein
MNSELETLLSRVALACGIGLLIGLERGWRTRDALPGSRTAGVRTFAISGLLGGIVGALAGGPDGALSIAGSLLIAVAFATFAAVLRSSFARKIRPRRHFPQPPRSPGCSPSCWVSTPC